VIIIVVSKKDFWQSNTPTNFTIYKEYDDDNALSSDWLSSDKVTLLKHKNFCLRLPVVVLVVAIMQEWYHLRLIPFRFSWCGPFDDALESVLAVARVSWRHG